MSHKKRSKAKKPHPIDLEKSSRGYHSKLTQPVSPEAKKHGAESSTNVRNAHANFSPRTTLSQPRHK